MKNWLTVAFVLAGGIVAQGDDWPQFRGATGNGVSSETGLPEAWSADAGVSWTVPLPGRGNSSPAVTSQRIDLTTQTDDDSLWVISIDRRSGELLHKINVGRGTLAVTPPDLATHRQNAATPSPVADEEHIWAFFGTGLLVCLEARTGTIAWQRDLARDYGQYDITYGMSSSPRLWGDFLYIMCLTKNRSSSYVLALNKATGEEAWKVPRHYEVHNQIHDDSYEAYSSPMIWQPETGAELIVSGTAFVDAYDPASGKQLWFLEGPVVDGPVGRVIASAAVGSKMVVALGPNPSGAGKGRVIGIQDHHEQWSYTLHTPDSSTPVLANGLLYMVSDKGLAACLDAESGERIWEKRLGGGPYHASLVAGDGKVYFLGIDGVCTVIEQGRSGQILSRNALAGTFYATPAISDGMIYFRGYEALYAVGGK